MVGIVFLIFLVDVRASCFLSMSIASLWAFVSVDVVGEGAIPFTSGGGVLVIRC